MPSWAKHSFRPGLDVRQLSVFVGHCSVGPHLVDWRIGQERQKVDLIPAGSPKTDERQTRFDELDRRRTAMTLLGLPV